MSSPFANEPAGLRNTISDVRGKAALAVAAAKQKKEDTGRTIEGSLGGLKVMLGGKAITKKIIEDPVVKKFGSQLKTKIADGVKKAANDATENVKAKLSDAGNAVKNKISESIRPGVRANPAAEGADEAAAQSEQATSGIMETGFPLSSGEYNVISQQTLAASPDDIDAALSAAKAGDASQGVSDLVVSNTAETSFPTTSSAVSSTTTAPAKAFDDEVIPKGGSGVDVSNANTAAGSGGTISAEAGADASTDAAVGFGEAALSALDAIPFVDLFTLAAGAGLAAAAGSKHPPVKATMPPPSQSHVAFQAGFASV